MKTKEIYDVFGIAPSTFSDWNKEDNKKKHFTLTGLKNLTFIQEYYCKHEKVYSHD